MKFIHDGWHWLEVDDFGNVIGEMSNAQHAYFMQNAVANHAAQWMHYHLSWEGLMALPDHLNQLLTAVGVQ